MSVFLFGCCPLTHFLKSLPCIRDIVSSLFHLMRAIACAHASTRTTSLRHVKIARRTSVFKTYCLGQKENERNIKKIKLNSYHFSLTFHWVKSV